MHKNVMRILVILYIDFVMRIMVSYNHNRKATQPKRSREWLKQSAPVEKVDSFQGNYKLYITCTRQENRSENMTNQMIIFYESQELAEAGVIDYTGRTIIVELPDGSKMEAKDTEAIHTFQEWKRAGYMVQKGQKAIAKIAIWNFTDKASKATKAAREAAGADTEKPDPHYYMKESAFFKASQVAPIEA